MATDTCEHLAAGPLFLTHTADGKFSPPSCPESHFSKWVDTVKVGGFPW